MLLRHAQLNVGPWLTEAIGAACQTSQAALQLLVIPGNPGLCSFYTRFIEQLYEVFHGAVNVLAVSHVGHDSANLTRGEVWCLDSQIRHKVLLLKEHLMGPGKPPVVVLAHSIGSYIMLQAIKQLEEEAEAAGARQAALVKQQLPKVVLLTPFLATDWTSPRQRTLQLAARVAPVLAAAAGAVGRLPLWLQDRLLPLIQPGADPHSWDSLKGLMNFNSAYNNFHLAHHEFRDLDGPVDWQLIERLGSRASVVCAPRDMWFPEQHYHQLCRELPDVQVYWRDDLTHAFCLQTRQCEVVAQLVYQSVSSTLGQCITQHVKHSSNLVPGDKSDMQQLDDCDVLIGNDDCCDQSNVTAQATGIKQCRPCL